MPSLIDLSDPNSIVIRSLVLAGAVVLVRGFWVARAHRLTPLTRMGKGNWEFGSSWATTLTTAGAFLSTLLSATGTLFAAAGATAAASGAPTPAPSPTSTPASPSLSTTWTALNLLFAFIVLIAPLLYNAIRREEMVKPDADHQAQGSADQFQYLGYFGVFLVASLLVLWGVTGELLTVASIFETPGMRGATPIIRGVLDSTVMAAIVLSYVYLWLGIDRIVSEQLAAPASADDATYHRSSLRVQRPKGDNLLGKRQDWTFF